MARKIIGKEKIETSKKVKKDIGYACSECTYSVAMFCDRKINGHMECDLDNNQYYLTRK